MSNVRRWTIIGGSQEVPYWWNQGWELGGGMLKLSNVLREVTLCGEADTNSPLGHTRWECKAVLRVMRGDFLWRRGHFTVQNPISHLASTLAVNGIVVTRVTWGAFVQLRGHKVSSHPCKVRMQSCLPCRVTLCGGGDTSQSRTP